VKLVPAVQINNKEITFACNATSPMSYSQKKLLEYTVIYIFTLLNQIFVYEILKINAKLKKLVSDPIVMFLDNKICLNLYYTISHRRIFFYHSDSHLHGDIK
jgi:hypothetical protein